MLVSHSHQFIFIKTKKTAGSSIQDYLAPYCRNGIVEKYIPGGHRPAKEVKKMVGEDIWNSYLKICPVRNPWDTIASWYYWRKRERPWYVKLKRVLQGRPAENKAHRSTFKDYIDGMKKHNRINLNAPIMFITDSWEDYFFIRYEHLNEDMKSLCEKIGIPYHPEKLPKKKTGVRKEKDYKVLYDAETQEIVRNSFQKEIDKFGYEF